jgi:hypothetical protein
MELILNKVALSVRQKSVVKKAIALFPQKLSERSPMIN